MIPTHIPLKGHSMWPLMKDGDGLIIEKCEPKNVTLGDIVVFKSKAGIIAHRIIKTDGEFIMKGDRALHPDQCLRTDIIGVVTGISRNGKDWVWGIHGHPLKVIFAKLSCLHRAEWPKPLRRFFAIMLAVFALILPLFFRSK